MLLLYQNLIAMEVYNQLKIIVTSKTKFSG